MIQIKNEEIIKLITKFIILPVRIINNNKKKSSKKKILGFIKPNVIDCNLGDFYI